MGQKFVKRKQRRNVAAHRLSLLESRRLRAIDEKANGSTGKVKHRSPELSGASGAAEEQHQIVRGHRTAFGEGQSGIAGGRLDRFSTRSEERRVGKACVSTGRSRWSPVH